MSDRVFTMIYEEFKQRGSVVAGHAERNRVNEKTLARANEHFNKQLKGAGC